jgi:hypothetical protein
MKFKNTDNFLIRLPENQQSESYIIKMGTYGLGSRLFISKANTQQELDN